MTTQSTTPSAARLSSVMPGLSVRDLQRAITFYTQQLGFSLTFQNAAAFAIVRRDQVEIGLTCDRSGEKAGHSGCYVKMAGIDAIYSEFLKQGVAITHPLRNENYGMREFMITDPDGNTVNFGEPI